MRQLGRVGSMVLMATALVPMAASAQFYSNGGLNPQPLSSSGVAAPAGFFWSELQADEGNTTESNSIAGFSVNNGAVRLADDFVIPEGEAFTIAAIEFYAYQTGASAATSPFTAYNLQVWNGRPGDAGASVIFGDTTTNRLTSSVNSTYFRIFNSTVPPPGSATGTTRTIWRNRLEISPPLVLTAGTYWLDWASTVANAGAHFQPSVTVAGTRTQPGWNARQFNVPTATWADAVDTGNPTSAPDVLQDFPFDLFGPTDPIHKDSFEDPPPP